MSDQQTVEANGSAPRMVPRAQVEDELVMVLTEGYKPSLPAWVLGDDAAPQFWPVRDVERMMVHGHVRQCLALFCSGIAGAEFWGGKNPQAPDDPNGLPICAENPEVGDFVFKQVNRFWDRGVPRLQRASYPYGWGCGENLFTNEGGLEWDGLVEFSPTDSYLVTIAKRPVGARVKQVQSPTSPGKGEVDLWFGTKDVPAKALWYVHNPRCNQFYGQSQLVGGWKDWRRCATKGGAEMVMDGGFFRLGYRSPLVRYPDEDMQSLSQIQGTQLDSRGNPRRPSRDFARQWAEQIQAGAAVGMPSKKYPQDQGGDYMWDVQDWGYDFDGTHLIAYAEHLQRQMSKGIGTPQEVIEAMEGGSGFSGRNIPVEAWFFTQQHIADAFLGLFVRQVLRPLVRWRFGEVKWSVECKNLLESRRKAQAGGDVKNKPGVDAATPGVSPTHQGASNHPLAGNNPPPGPMGGPMQPTGPAGTMLSVGGVTRAQSLAKMILSMGRAA